MTLIHSIKSTLGLSRVEYSGSFSKGMKKRFSNMVNVEKLAAENDVYVKLSPSEKLGNAFVQVMRKGIDHVADVPAYVKSHDTGDQVYINWTKVLGAKDVPSNEFAVSTVVKQFCKEV